MIKYEFQPRDGDFAPTTGLIKVDNIITTKEELGYRTSVIIEDKEIILWYKLDPYLYDIKRSMEYKTGYYFEVKHKNTDDELYYKK